MRRQFPDMPFGTLLSARSISIVTFLALCSILLAPCFSAQAQQPGKVYRIGYLANPPGIGSNEEILRQSLRDFGYIEGRNLVIEWRFSKGKLDRLPDLAADLARRKVDCIITIGVSPPRGER